MPCLPLSCLLRPWVVSGRRGGEAWPCASGLEGWLGSGLGSWLVVLVGRAPSVPVPSSCSEPGTPGQTASLPRRMAFRSGIVGSMQVREVSPDAAINVTLTLSLGAGALSPQGPAAPRLACREGHPADSLGVSGPCSLGTRSPVSPALSPSCRTFS